MKLTEEKILEIGFEPYEHTSINDEKGWKLTSNGYIFSIWESIDHGCYTFFPAGINLSHPKNFPDTHPTNFEMMRKINLSDWSLVTDIDELFGLIAEHYTQSGIEEQQYQFRKIIGINS